jgi:putative ATP-dependent endonuclease of OLD family
LGLVLSVDALNRHPVVDEYEFYNRQYIDSNNQPIEIRLNVILTDLSFEDRFLFKKHIRVCNDDMHGFADDVDDRSLVGDGSHLHWVLPVVFIARYEQNEQDFITGTFFDYPSALDVDTTHVDQSFVGGRTIFGRAEKCYCGFIFLRPSRNTSKLLSLHSGSLLERILVLSRKNFPDNCEPPSSSSSGSINLEFLATGHKANARLKSFITRPLTAETAR